MSEPYRVVSALPSGTAFARYVQALALAADDMYTAMQKAEQWRDTPTVAATLALRAKSAVAPMTTADSTAASPLASYGVGSEAITLLKAMSIYGTLQGLMQQVPLHVKIPVESGSGYSGGWVAEGAPIPVQKTAFATSIQEFYKYGVITPLSEELITTSDPAAVPTITRLVLGGLAKAIDVQLLTPTITLSAGVRPASILNGATERVTTGSTAATIAADLASMLGSVTTAGPLTWVMKPKTLSYISLTLGSQAAGLPNTLLGVRVIASTSSPAQIALLDPSAIIFSDSGQFDLDASRYAALELNDSPADPTTASTLLSSMYQRNDVAIKAMRALAWLNLSPTTSAAFMTVAY